MEPLSETQVIQNLRQTEDPSAQYYAAWWLGKMRSQHPDAILFCSGLLKHWMPRRLIQSGAVSLSTQSVLSVCSGT